MQRSDPVLDALGYRLAADAILVVHAGIVAFVVVGLALFAVGGAAGWRWVRNPWLRVAHLGAIAVVVAQAWAGAICPLTTWEMRLRELAGDVTYAGGFVAHWIGRALYWDAPPEAFTVLYTVFGAAVIAVWVLVPPDFRRRRRNGPG